MNDTKYCEYCGNQISVDAVVCTSCGKQLEVLKTDQSNQNPQIIINNTNSNVMNNVHCGKECNKWVALLLCIFLGFFGAHKFYEGKIGMGILYLFTCGLFGIGWIIDIISLLFKPNPYYV